VKIQFGKYCFLTVILLLSLTSCEQPDPSTKFRGKSFNTREVNVFGIMGRQIIYFYDEGNGVSTFNTNDGGDKNGSWEYIDENKKKIRVIVTGKFDWRSGIWEFDDDYTSIKHIDRGEYYFLRN